MSWYTYGSMWSLTCINAEVFVQFVHLPCIPIRSIKLKSSPQGKQLFLIHIFFTILLTCILFVIFPSTVSTFLAWIYVNLHSTQMIKKSTNWPFKVFIMESVIGEVNIAWLMLILWICRNLNFSKCCCQRRCVQGNFYQGKCFSPFFCATVSKYRGHIDFGLSVCLQLLLKVRLAIHFEC
jgi:hypothetical protein